MSRLNIGGRWFLTLFGIFLVASVTISALAAITVLWPHEVLVNIWSTKQAAYRQLLHTPLLAGVGFAALSVVLSFATVGWFVRRKWGWLLAITVLGVSLLSDILHMILARQWVDGIGEVIEALVLLWATSSPVRNQFAKIATKR